MLALDPNTIALGTGAATLAYASLRPVFAKAALKKADEGVTTAIAQFRAAQAKVMAPLTIDQRQGATVFATILSKGDQRRSAFKDKIKAIKIPHEAETGTPQNPKRLLDGEMMAIATAVTGFYATGLAVRFSSLLHDNVAFKMAEAAGEHPAALVLNAMDTKMVAVMDQTGLTDHVLQQAQHIANVVPDHLMDGAAAAFGKLNDFMSVPGLPSGVFTGIQELFMLADGVTSLEDSLTMGVLPAVARGVAIKSAIATELAMGGITCGLLTLGTVIASTWGKNYFIGREIDKESDRLRPYTRRLEAQRDSSIDTINAKIRQHFKGFAQDVENAPEMMNERSMKDLWAKIERVYEAERKATAAWIKETSEQGIAALPKKNWVDRILFIDRPGRITPQYQKAANEDLTAFAWHSHRSLEAMRKDPRRTLQMMGFENFLKDGPFAKLVTALPEELRPVMADYDATMDDWSIALKARADKGVEAVRPVHAAEMAKAIALTEELGPTMKPMRQRIKTMSARIGRTPEAALYI